MSSSAPSKGCRSHRRTGRVLSWDNILVVRTFRNNEQFDLLKEDVKSVNAIIGNVDTLWGIPKNKQVLEYAGEKLKNPFADRPFDNDFDVEEVPMEFKEGHNNVFVQASSVVPLAPKNIAVIPNRGPHVHLRWEKPSIPKGKLKRYDVEYRSAGGGDAAYTQLSFSSSDFEPGCSYDYLKVTPLEPGRQYLIRIRAVAEIKLHSNEKLWTEEAGYWGETPQTIVPSRRARPDDETRRAPERPRKRTKHTATKMPEVRPPSPPALSNANAPREDARSEMSWSWDLNSVSGAQRLARHAQRLAGQPESPAAESESLPDSASAIQSGVEGRQIQSPECGICLNSEPSVAAIPCGHVAYCTGCAQHNKDRLRKCIVCRGELVDVVTVRAPNMRDVTSQSCLCCKRAKPMLFVPCGHFIFCGSCSVSFKFCPECKADIAGRHAIFQT